QHRRQQDEQREATAVGRPEPSRGDDTVHDADGHHGELPAEHLERVEGEVPSFPSLSHGRLLRSPAPAPRSARSGLPGGSARVPGLLMASREGAVLGDGSAMPAPWGPAVAQGTWGAPSRRAASSSAGTLFTAR